MIIKKYQGKTEEEAITLAKQELGESVVVMNVKELKKNSFLGVMKTKMVEVTVALEVENEKPKVADKKEEPVSNTTGSFSGVFAENEKEAAKNLEVTVLEDKLDSLQNLLVKQLQKPELEEPEKVSEEKDEIKEEKPEELVKFMKLLQDTMFKNEVDEKYINQILEEIEKAHKPNMPFDYALANTYQRMILKFGQVNVITKSDKGVKVIFFVGPTGVGKTTTIAKIASKFSVEYRKKIALLTADTFRIAAVEQLRTYANILDVPFKIIYTNEEMEESVEEFKEYDFIFVDTAGHSHHNESQKEAIHTFINSVSELVDKDIYLVVSATTKYNDLLNIVDTYKDEVDFNLIFTKLDETASIGNLLNISLYSGAAIAYTTSGQNVPEDIEEFNAQATVKQLLGGKK